MDIFDSENIEIATLPVGQMKANCYLVIDKLSSKALIIDPGDDADYIERIIADKNCKPTNILATHGHFDHIMAVTELKLAYQIPFLISMSDKFLVKNMASSALHFLGIKVDPPPVVDDYLNEKKKIIIGKNHLQVIETPGHTPGSICLYIPSEKALFTGDTIFADSGVGRTDFSYSSSSDLQKSIKKIFSLPKKTMIYPGHGRESTLEEEKGL